MLAVQKQDDNRNSTEALTASGFGKVLNSIQGLQQRLGDFSYGEVSIAEAKVKLLVKQLGALRDNLSTVVRLKEAARETTRHINSLPKENYSLVGPDSLEKHPQLHAIIKASKLIRIQGQLKAALTVQDAISLDTEGNSEPSNAPTNPQEFEAGAKPTPAVPVDKKNSAANSGEKNGATQNRLASKKPAVPREMTFEQRDAASLAKQIDSSSLAPSKQTFPSNNDQAFNRPTDWTFDFNDPPAASIDFEFPQETLSAAQTPLSSSPTKNLSEPKHSTKTVANAALHARLHDGAAKPPAAAQLRVPAKASGERAAITLAQSKALVLTRHDFDQRLLADVIKNYGDFSTSANLPATIEAAAGAKPGFDKPGAHRTRQFEESSARPREVPNNKKAGDLDRQLKKIIKDYGEYDLYQRPSVFNLRTGGIAAFVVLGLVLGGLYWFGTPSQERPAPLRREVAPPAAEFSTSSETSKPAKTNVLGDEGSVSPGASNDPAGSVTVTKQTP